MASTGLHQDSPFPHEKERVPESCCTLIYLPPLLLRSKPCFDEVIQFLANKGFKLKPMLRSIDVENRISTPAFPFRYYNVIKLKNFCAKAIS